MKKLALTMVCAVAVTGAAFAQGTLGWNVISPAGMTGATNTVSYSPLFGVGGVGPGGAAGGAAYAKTSAAAGGFYYELLYNTLFTGLQVSGVLAPSNSFATLFTSGTWHDSGLEATNALTAGFLAPVAGNAGASVNGWANGTTNNIVLVGWSADLGTSWNVVSNELATGTYVGVLGVQNGFFGVSAAGYINPNLAPAAGATLFNNAATANGLPINSLLTPLYLLPTPEPATIALLGLSGVSLLLFRRRKS